MARFPGARAVLRSIRRACAGSPGPCSPRSADGPVIIISRPVLPDHFLTPWTAVSLASPRRYMNSHFSSVLYFVHSINLYCDPALGSIHLCRTSGKSSPRGSSFPFFLGLYQPRKKKRTIRIVFLILILILPLKLSHNHSVAKRNKTHLTFHPSHLHPWLECLVLKLNNSQFDCWDLT